MQKTAHPTANRHFGSNETKIHRQLYTRNGNEKAWGVEKSFECLTRAAWDPLGRRANLVVPAAFLPLPDRERGFRYEIAVNMACASKVNTLTFPR